MRPDGQRAINQTFSMYPDDSDRLNALAKARCVSLSVALRECLPNSDLLGIYQQLAALNPGLTYAMFITQLVREWMLSHAPVMKLSDLLAGLRSDEADERIRAGKLLSYSVGTGLRLSGESNLDVEHGVGRDISNLIARGMEGDSSATDFLEQILTNQLPDLTPETATAESAKKETDKPRSKSRW